MNTIDIGFFLIRKRKGNQEKEEGRKEDFSNKENPISMMNTI